VTNKDSVAGSGNSASQQAKFKSILFYLLPAVAAALIVAYATWKRVSDSHLKKMIITSSPFSTNVSSLYFCSPRLLAVYTH
jgi:hypothetical protein